MILAICLWNLMSIFDCSYYQNIRYQKDRYVTTIDFDLKDILLMAFLSIFILLFEIRDMSIMFDLILFILLPKAMIHAKKQIQSLVITKRIIRLFVVIGIVDCLVFCFTFFIFDVLSHLFLTFLIVFHHFVFYFFIIIMHPIEMMIRKRFVSKAKLKLDHFSGIVIGITGSYGKTSIKNLVYDVLSMKYLCLKTKASYNNQMGITKTILEEMDHQEVFICEMGADHVHEIEDLCKFVQPTIGVVSAIGPQHLSTFHSIENILHEKMQLLESLPNTGMGFYNFDNFYLNQYDMQLKCDVTRVGIHSYAQIKAIHIQCNHLGSQFDVWLDHKLVHFETILLGEHNILNCLFAIALGHYLKVDIVLIQMAILCTKAVAHRMELKPFYKGMCIDNAYNSNPESASASLEVLKKMPGRHYIITPGFIDLGELNGYYSEQFGKEMNFCEKIGLVGECKEIKKGLIDSGYDMENVYTFMKMKDAMVFMSAILEEEDTLLIENDIPEILMNT